MCEIQIHANIAFVDAITSVFYVGAGFVVAAVLFAITLVPRKMRSEQAVLEAPADAVPADESEEAEPTTLPEPVKSLIARALICCCAAATGRCVGQGRCRCHPSHVLEHAGGN